MSLWGPAPWPHRARHRAKRVLGLYINPFVAQASVGSVSPDGLVPTLIAPRTVIVTDLMNRLGTLLPNQTNLHWAWFDVDDPNLITGAPTDKGSAETTDAGADMTITLSNTTLNPGQFGLLLLQSNDQVNSGLYRLAVG